MGNFFFFLSALLALYLSVTLQPGGGGEDRREAMKGAGRGAGRGRAGRRRGGSKKGLATCSLS